MMPSREKQRRSVPILAARLTDPRCFERAAERAEEVLRGCAALLRNEASGADVTAALTALEAEGIGLASEVAHAVDQERGPTA